MKDMVKSFKDVFARLKDVFKRLRDIFAPKKDAFKGFKDVSSLRKDVFKGSKDVSAPMKDAFQQGSLRGVIQGLKPVQPNLRNYRPGNGANAVPHSGHWSLLPRRS